MTSRCGRWYNSRAAVAVALLVVICHPSLLLQQQVAVVEAAPRGGSASTSKSSEKHKKNNNKGETQSSTRVLSGQRLNRIDGPTYMGGAAGRAGVKGGQRRKPIPLPPPNLPMPLSDHTSIEYNGKIYIGGGCESIEGNQLFVLDNNNDASTGQENNNNIFVCDTISDVFMTFQPNKFQDHFSYLPKLPRSRYRHTCTAIPTTQQNNNNIRSGGGHIWFIGGRDVNDNLVNIIDVFDVESSTWIASFTIPPTLVVSDHASFSVTFHDGDGGDDDTNNSYIYIVGGYDVTYTAQSTVYRINTNLSVSSGSLVYDLMSPMLHPRGDISATTIKKTSIAAAAEASFTSSSTASTTKTTTYAYVAGGYDHLNYFCESRNIVERYDVTANVWTTISTLVDNRADYGFVTLNDFLFVIGGESTFDDICYLDVVLPPGELIVPVTTIEAYKPRHDDSTSTFTIISDDDRQPRYRSSTVVWSPTSTVYVIGGQELYDEECQCYKTSNVITAYRELVDLAEMYITDSPTPSPVSSTPQPVDVVTVSNDLCEDAIELDIVSFGLPINAIAYGNTDFATIKDVETCGNTLVASDQPGVWYYVMGSGGVLTALTCNDFTNFDTKISIYRNTCSNLQCVDANDDGCENFQSRISWNSVVGEKYYILVHGFQTSPTGNYAVQVRATEPVNDNCDQAQGPLVAGDSVWGTTIFATDDFGGNGAALGRECGFGSYGNVPGIWYKTIGTGSIMTADTCDQRTDYDTKIHIFDGDNCGRNGLGLQCLIGNDNNVECGELTTRRSKVSWQSEVGKLYHIYVHGFQGDPQGLFILTIS